MKNKNPIVSIIVPVYNTEKYLERCIVSLRQQTLNSIEIILIDDGSSDNSGNICDDYASKDDRIKVIHKRNEGQGLARNSGLELSEGKYVLFVDSDDYIETDTCEKLVSIIELENADLCSFGYRIETKEGRIFYEPQLPEKRYENEELRRKFVLHFFGDSPDDPELRGVSACMTMFRNEIIQKENIHFQSEREYLSEDTIFSLDFCLRAKKAIICPKVFYHYCQNGESFSHAYRKNRFTLTQTLAGVLGEYASKYHLEDEVKVRISMMIWINLMECIKQEVRRIGDIDFGEIYKQIQRYLRSETVKSMTAELKEIKLPAAQKVFRYAIQYQLTLMVIMLAWIRNKKGL